MEKLIDRLSALVAQAFESAGYDQSFGRVSVSNRPDLCQYQCNGALAAAKQYHKAPQSIAQDVAARLADDPAFEAVQTAAPGFLNLTLRDSYLMDYLSAMRENPRLGLPTTENPRTIVLDYGGPNVAKPLHVGHLRSAIIGESVKRICRYFGDRVVGDVHLGDWGLQMGLIIAELHERRPDLPFFYFLLHFFQML